MELNNFNYNDIDGSISLTFSDSNDDIQTQNDNKLHQNELEISYKSAFFSDKKCKDQKALSQQIDCKTLFKKEEMNSPKSPECAFANGISLKNTATTSEQQTCSVNTNYNNNNSDNKNISNYSISDVNSNKHQQMNMGTHNSKYATTYDKEHQMLSKRSKSSNFDIALNKIKIDSLINSGVTCPSSSSTSHIRGSPIINNANPFLNNNNNTVNYNNVSSSHNDTTKPNPQTTKLILHKNKKPSTTPLPINKALSSHRDQVHTYLKQMMKQYAISSSEIKKNSQKNNKSAKRTSYSHSHREKQFPNNIAICDINPTTKKKISSNLIKHTSSSSCLLLKKNQNSFKSSQSTYSFFNSSSSCFMKESPSINTKNKRNCFYSTLNTPTNLKSKKIDSRNSLLKSNVNSLNKKQCNTPHLGSSSVSIANSNLTQRINNNKKIYIQSPHNLFHNKKNIIPFIKAGIKTSPSPPKLRETNKQHKDQHSNNNKDIIINHNSNNSNHHTTTNCSCSSNGKKQVYTINNFSKYVKKSRGGKDGKKNLHGDSFVHSTSNAPKIYLKANKEGYDMGYEGVVYGKKGKSSSKQKQVPKEIMLNY